MTKEQLLFKKIWEDNCDGINLIIDYNCDNEYCYLQEKEIYIPTRSLLSPTNISLFDLLHEIGHLRTNKIKMKRCLQECLATRWAIGESKKYGVVIPKWRQRQFNEDVEKWKLIAIKHNAKNMPKPSELKLDWSVMK